MVRKLAMGRQAKGSHGKPGGSRAPKPGARHATRSHGAIRKPAEQPRSRQASMPAPSASSWGSVFEQAMEVRRYARVAACACPHLCGPRLYALVCVGARAWAPARSACRRRQDSARERAERLAQRRHGAAATPGDSVMARAPSMSEDGATTPIARAPSGDWSMASPGSGLSASPNRKQPHEPEATQPEATPTQPTAGFARMRACVCACVRACVRACSGALTCACARACEPSMCTCARACSATLDKVTPLPSTPQHAELVTPSPKTASAAAAEHTMKSCVRSLNMNAMNAQQRRSELRRAGAQLDARWRDMLQPGSTVLRASASVCVAFAQCSYPRVCVCVRVCARSRAHAHSHSYGITI